MSRWLACSCACSSGAISGIQQKGAAVHQKGWACHFHDPDDRWSRQRAESRWTAGQEEEEGVDEMTWVGFF